MCSGLGVRKLLLPRKGVKAQRDEITKCNRLALEGFECLVEGSGLMIKTPGAWEGFGVDSPSKKITPLLGA